MKEAKDMKQGWEYKKLGEVCDIINGKNQRAVENPKGIYPIMGSGGIIGYADDYLCNEGTTIIGRKGSINKPIYVNQKFWNVDTAFGLQPKEGTESRFLFYLCKSINFERYNKSVTIPSLVKSDLLKIDIHIPYFSVQKQIASELDLLSGVIEKQKAQLEELDKLAQSIFYDMFGDPVTNEKGWTVKKLKDLSSKITNGNTPKGGSDVYVEEGILFFRSQNVWRNKIILDDIAFIDDATHELLHNSSLLHNDILITKTGRFNTENSSLGRAALYTGEDNKANINGHVYLVRLNAEVDKKFVLYILISESYRQLIRRVCVGGIDKRQLNKNHIEDFPIICPPLSLQQEFAAKVEVIEAMKAKVRQSLKEAETLFNSRMDYYFN
jgi:restriction endonuclease S subunit